MFDPFKRKQHDIFDPWPAGRDVGVAPGGRVINICFWRRMHKHYELGLVRKQERRLLLHLLENAAGGGDESRHHQRQELDQDV